VLPGSPHKPPTVLKAQTLTADEGAEHRLPLRGIPAQHPSGRPVLGDSPELRPARQTPAEPGAAAPPERWTQSTGVFEYCAQVLRNTPTSFSFPVHPSHFSLPEIRVAGVTPCMQVIRLIGRKCCGQQPSQGKQVALCPASWTCFPPPRGKKDCFSTKKPPLYLTPRNSKIRPRRQDQKHTRSANMPLRSEMTLYLDISSLKTVTGQIHVNEPQRNGNRPPTRRRAP